MQWLDITDRQEFKPVETRPNHRLPKGILLVSYTEPQPGLGYAIRQDLAARPQENDLGHIMLAVRSVGKAGRRYYYAADLRFLVHDGFQCAWPVRDSEAWPELSLEISEQNHGWKADLIGSCPAVGKIGSQRLLLTSWQTRPMDDDERPRIELMRRAMRWIRRHRLQVTIDGQALEDALEAATADKEAQP